MLLCSTTPSLSSYCELSLFRCGTQNTVAQVAYQYAHLRMELSSTNLSLTWSKGTENVFETAEESLPYNIISRVLELAISFQDAGKNHIW